MVIVILRARLLHPFLAQCRYHRSIYLWHTIVGRWATYYTTSSLHALPNPSEYRKFCTRCGPYATPTAWLSYWKNHTEDYLGFLSWTKQLAPYWSTLSIFRPMSTSLEVSLSNCLNQLKIDFGNSLATMSHSFLLLKSTSILVVLDQHWQWRNCGIWVVRGCLDAG